MSGVSGDLSATDQGAEQYTSATSAASAHVSEELTTPSSELDLANLESRINNSDRGYAASEGLHVQVLRRDSRPSIAIPLTGDSTATATSLPDSETCHQTVPFSKGIVDEYRASLFLPPGDE